MFGRSIRDGAGRRMTPVAPLRAALLAALAMAGVAAPLHAQDRVTTSRVPDGGLQPEARVDGHGTVHVVYFKGEPAHGDLYYIHSADGVTFSAPLRVNSQPGSAIALGTVRGGQIALGGDGRVHVAWNGSGQALPKSAGETAPMLYTRLNAAGDAFAPQRNVITSHAGIDGGGSVAADGAGNVYVAWHAPRAEPGEADRWVWVAHSRDDGKTFGPETAANPTATGACGCCGLSIFAAPDGGVYILYRSALELVHRDMYLLSSHDHGEHFRSTKLSEWNIGACVMSTASLAAGDGLLLATWESQEQVYVGQIDAASGAMLKIAAVPGPANDRKHPRVALSPNGDYIVAWTEGTAWNRGGSVAWQVFARDGQPRPGQSGRAAGLPAWGVAAVYADPTGNFHVMY